MGRKWWVGEGGRERGGWYWGEVSILVLFTDSLWDSSQKLISV